MLDKELKNLNKSNDLPLRMCFGFIICFNQKVAAYKVVLPYLLHR